ncbi:hypothetical protein AURDEDRAFT_184275 [Auricularia subglabra TFB-10046 SS5]|nr:hypothetical protein AURDEDRAFT_184275 [Auricularia subglabra TFB-10046 SS5]
MAESLVVAEDDNQSLISYFPPDGWDDRHGTGFEMFHGSSYHVTDVEGGHVTFTFNGSYVAYYSDLNADHDNFTVSVDGNSVQTASSYAPSWTNGSRLLFAAPLNPGPHILTVTNVKGGAWMGLDYFMYLPASAPSSTTSTPTAPTVTPGTSSVETIPATASSTITANPAAGTGIRPQSSSTSTGGVSPTAPLVTDNLAPPLTSCSTPDSHSAAKSGLTPTTLHAIIGATCALVLIGLTAVLAVLLRRRQVRRTTAHLAQPPPAYAEADPQSPSVGVDERYRGSMLGSSTGLTDVRTRLSSKSGGSSSRY